MLSVPFKSGILSVLFCFCGYLLAEFGVKEYSVQKTEESSFFRGLTPRFHVIFHVICFSTTNRDITENN